MSTRYPNKLKLQIVKEYENSDKPESILEKYSIDQSKVHSWQWSIDHCLIPKDNTCPIHKTPLEEGEAEMHYGLVRVRKVYRKTKKEHFPFSASFRLSEAIPIMPPTREVEYCPKCREAEAAWVAEFGSKFVGPPDWQDDWLIS